MLRLLALSVLSVVVGTAAAQNAARGQRIAGQVCAACHAADGNSVAPTNPKIAGQFAEYLQKQLGDFKAHQNKKPARDNPIMTPMASNLSDDDIQSVAAYYAGQKLPRDRRGQGPRRPWAEDLARRHRGDQRSGMRRLPRPGRRRDSGAVPSSRGPVRRVRRGAAQGLQGRRALQRSERHHARRRGANDGARDPGGSAVRGGAALAEVIDRSPC